MITGASSGIGRALALEYASNGIILYLCGRNHDRLDEVGVTCEAMGATVKTRVIDVSVEAEMNDWINAIETLDLVFANAGIGKPFKYEDDLASHTKEIFDVNLAGVFNTIHPVIAKMKIQSVGQIAIISSMAGYHGMPSAPAYSASKVAVKAYGEALRGFYYDHGLEVNVICPGFVRSRITDKNKFAMPFFMEADKAARIIQKGLEKNKGLIAFPWQTRMLMGSMVRFLPEFILEKILRSLPEK